MSPVIYLASLTAKIYKLIPMREDMDSGKDVFLDKYIDSLLIELMGALDTYPALRDSDKYISVVNTIQYLAHNETEGAAWRREAFKMLRTIERLRDAFGGVSDG